MPEDVKIEREKSEYDEKAWEAFITKEEGFGTLITMGEHWKVPKEKIHEAVRNLVKRLLGRGNSELVYRFMTKAKTGQELFTAVETQTLAKKSYDEAVAENDFSAAEIWACEIFGPDSKERKAAAKAARAAAKVVDEQSGIPERKTRKTKISISNEASFADLERALGAASEELSEIFGLELVDNFDQDLADEISERLGNSLQAENAGLNFLQFMSDHGYSKKEVLTSLPLKFLKSN